MRKRQRKKNANKIPLFSYVDFINWLHGDYPIKYKREYECRFTTLTVK